MVFSRVISRYHPQLSTLFAVVTISVNNHYTRLFNYEEGRALKRPLQCGRSSRRIRFIIKQPCVVVVNTNRFKRITL